MLWLFHLLLLDFRLGISIPQAESHLAIEIHTPGAQNSPVERRPGGQDYVVLVILGQSGCLVSGR